MKKMILPTLKILSVLLNNHGASASASSSASMIGVCASTMPQRLSSPHRVKAWCFAVFASTFVYAAFSSVAIKTSSAALNIRNRITHPKTIEDLKLSETEVQKVIDTGAWFLKCRRELFQQFIDRMQRLEDILDKPQSVPSS